MGPALQHCVGGQLGSELVFPGCVEEFVALSLVLGVGIFAAFNF